MRRSRLQSAAFSVMVASLVLMAPTVALSQGSPPECQFQDVSGFWQGVFSGEINQGEVQLFITQSHRRYHVTALANGAVLAEGDGTIAESGQSHFNGAGPLIKKISADGQVEGECFATFAGFEYTAEYIDGTQDSGMVTLPVHLGTCGPECVCVLCDTGPSTDARRVSW